MEIELEYMISFLNILLSGNL